MKAYKDPEKEKERKKWSDIRIKYGLSQEDWEKIYNDQEGKCAICGREAENYNLILCVDHDHSTREIRGLLCDWCNRSLLGALEKGSIDTINIIEALKNYLGYLMKEHHYGIVPDSEQARRRRREITIT